MEEKKEFYYCPICKRYLSDTAENYNFSAEEIAAMRKFSIDSHKRAHEKYKTVIKLPL